MISRYTVNDTSWIDVESPTAEEITYISEEYNIPDLVTEDISTNTMHSKVDIYDDILYLVLHFPPSSQNEETSTDQEIDFIISEKFIITIRYEKIYSLEKISSYFEKRFSLSDRAINGGIIFYEFMKELYNHSLHKLDAITSNIDKFEINLFKGHEERMVQKLSIESRKILDFKRALRFHPEILRSFKNSSPKLFGEGYTYYADSIIAEFNKVDSIVESNKETITELQRTNDSLLSTKQNTIMKRFTVLSFVALPLMLVTGIFGMNTGSGVMFIKDYVDFFVVLGGMAVTSLVMYTFFKLNRWI